MYVCAMWFPHLLHMHMILTMNSNHYRDGIRRIQFLYSIPKTGNNGRGERNSENKKLFFVVINFFSSFQCLHCRLYYFELHGFRGFLDICCFNGF